jgi:uncharacterized membrane protein HdeD (DUF308 family)
MNDRRFEPGKHAREMASHVKEGVQEGVEHVAHGVKEGAQSVKHGVQERVGDIKQGVDSKLSDLWWGLLLRGVIIAGLGLYLIFSPSSGLELLARGVGLFLIADGAVGLFSAASAKDRREFLAQGLVSLALGALLLIQPEFTEGAVTLALGGWALFTGGSLLWRSRRVERLDRLRGLIQTLATVLCVLGLVFVFWPGAATVGLAWVIGIGALIAAAVLLFLATKVKGTRGRLDS